MNQDVKMADVIIWAVGNGYRVNPVRYDMHRDAPTPKADERVFESFDAMVAYLRSVLPLFPVDSGITITTTRKRS